MRAARTNNDRGKGMELINESAFSSNERLVNRWVRIKANDSPSFNNESVSENPLVDP